MELLARLLGTTERVKIMRFFLHHKDSVLSLHDVSEKTKVKAIPAKKELAALASLGFIEKKKAKTVVEVTTAKKVTSKVKEVSGYILNAEFPHNEALKALLFDFQSLDKRELAARFKTLGRIKLFVVAGVFVGDEKSRVDILLVGEGIKKPKADKVFEVLSAELGREVIYAVMDIEEYEYRFKMYDKFVRDIMEMTHVVVIDKRKEAVK